MAVVIEVSQGVVVNVLGAEEYAVVDRDSIDAGEPLPPLPDGFTYVGGDVVTAVYDYNIYSDARLDHWTSDEVEAWRLAALHPDAKLVRYNCRLDAEGHVVTDVFTGDEITLRRPLTEGACANCDNPLVPTDGEG